MEQQNQFDWYRHVGASIGMLVAILSFTVLAKYIYPLYFVVLSVSISLYMYLAWTRNLVHNFLIAVALAPIFALPLAYFVFMADNSGPSAIYSLGPAYIMASCINLVVWGKRALPQKTEQKTSIS